MQDRSSSERYPAEVLASASANLKVLEVKVLAGFRKRKEK